MSWIPHVSGRLIRYATWEILATTSKGPYRLGDNFLLSYGLLIFVPSNHTLFPISKPLNPVSLIIFSWTCFNACWASSLASLMRVSRSLMSGMFASLDGWCARGTYPRISSKGDFLVDAFGQEFRVYCAKGNQDAHSFC